MAKSWPFRLRSSGSICGSKTRAFTPSRQACGGAATQTMRVLFQNTSGPQLWAAMHSDADHHISRKFTSRLAAMFTGLPSFMPGLKRHWLTAPIAC